MRGAGQWGVDIVGVGAAICSSLWLARVIQLVGSCHRLARSAQLAPNFKQSA
jgi:hypothetical protein